MAIHLPLSEDFGFSAKNPSGSTSVFLQLTLFMGLLSSTIMVLTQWFQILSIRRAEFAADKYSVDRGYGISLRNQLIALHVDNSGNLNPDPLYALYHYSHPALVERLQSIENNMALAAGVKTDAPYDKIADAYQTKFKEKIIEAHG